MRQKSLAWLLGALLIVAALGGYLFITRTGGVPENLHQYYPASTGFYVELAPDEKLGQRFIRFLESAAHQNAVQPAMAGKASAGADKAANLPASAPAGDVNQRFHRIFAQKFNSTFKPYFSLGIWPDAARTQTPEEPAHLLIVFPVQDEKLSLPALLRRFDVTVNDFTGGVYKLNNRQIAYLTEKNSRTTLAMLEGKLLITNSPSAMEAALGHILQKMPDVFDNPLNQRYLARLSPGRQGLFILNNTVYGPGALTGTSLGGASLDSASKGGKPQPARTIAQIMPVTVGTLHFQQDDFIATRFVTPVLLDQIPNPAVREDLRSVYRASADFDPGRQLPKDTSFYVGVAGLDKVYDLYANHLLPTRNRQVLKALDYMLTAYGLDLRGDVVSLLQNGTIIATRPARHTAPFRPMVPRRDAVAQAAPARQSVIIAVQNNADKQKTLDKLSAILATGRYPVKESVSAIGTTEMHVITLPDRQKTQVSYAAVGNSVMFAPPLDLSALFLVKKGTSKNLQKNKLYSEVMKNMPHRGSLVAYIDMKEQTELLARQLALRGQKLNQANWLQGVGLTLWSSEGGGADLIEGQLNMKLAPMERTSKE